MMRRIRKWMVPVVVIAVAATLVAAAAMQLRAARELEDATYDLRALAFAPLTIASPDIVVIELDESTMRGLPYRTPIPRDFLATLHRNIMKAEPWLVGYDIFFADPSFPDADRAFAEALKGGVVYAVEPMRSDGTVAGTLPLIRDELEGTGLADLPFNSLDATVRRARFSFMTANVSRPSFAGILFEAATGVDAAIVAGGDETYVRFSGPPARPGAADNAFTTYSAALVAKGLVPAAWLHDKIVLVGAAYEDLKDLYRTPYFARSTGYALMPGVEIHAQILSMLLTRQFVAALAAWQAWLLAFVLALGVTAATAGLSPWRAAIAGIVLAAAELALAVAAFRAAAIVVPVVAPLVAAVAALGSGLGWRALTEGRQRRFIKGAFARYVPAEVVERLSAHPELLRLGGEAREVTSLFSDIASFTTISERLPPRELVEFLNAYLSRMNEELFREGATLDKYEGDAIIAFFNAPLDVPGHAAAAARAALGIRRAGREITAAWRERCGRDIVTRVGMATGPAVVGNMGSLGRFDYTAIGDTINLASRLEGANKFYGTTVLAAESVVRGWAAAEFVTRPVDRVRVKGKQQPILLYEILGQESEIDRATRESLVAPYNEAFERFSRRELDNCRELLTTILARYPDDGPSRELLARCERAARELSWDLVTELTAK